VLIARKKGLALEVGAQTGQGYEPQLRPPHARPWLSWQTPYRDEYLTISLANGLALDARRDLERGRHPLMWVPHGDGQQRWCLHPAADGAAYLIESVRTGHVLDAPPDAVHGTTARTR
jgi:Ricin-type beta-trefoil lectin domain-like